MTWEHRHPTADVRVLMVDDYAPFLKMARQLVSASPGFVAAGEASSGREACEAISSTNPALVLMDVHMPDLDGIEATRWIRQFHADVVVVLMSANEPGTLPSAAFACGAAAVLRKQDLRPSILAQLWRAHGPTPSP